MKQIAIISGKGGTGKTSLTSAFASIVQNAVFADCDVNASDLHLILKPEIKYSFDFDNIKKVKIEQDECIKCGLCFNICRYNAVDRIRNQFYIREFSCVGCDLCRKACPVSAIEKIDGKSGEYYISHTRFGTLIYSQLSVGSDYGDKLIAFVREQAMEIAKEKNKDYLIVDGPPGIGSGAIATITGADLAVIMTYPTKSGLYELSRMGELLKKQDINSVVIINKYDLNTEISDEIETYCNNNKLKVLAKIPYNRSFTYAMMEQKSIIEYEPDSDISEIIKHAWNKISSLLFS